MLLGGSGLLLMLAFPKPGWGLLAHVALVPAVVVAVRSANAKRLVWTSYLVWLAWWLIGLRWLVPVTGGGYAALSAYLALYGSTSLLAVRWLDRGYPKLSYTATLPAVWVSLELIRSFFPAGGFSWFLLGHSQAPYLESHSPGWLIQVADVLGEHGVSLIVAMTNGLLADLLCRPWVRHTPSGRNRANPSLRYAAAAWGAVMIAALGYGAYRVDQTDRQLGSPQLEVVVIQTNVPQDNKNNPKPQQVVADWMAMMQLTRDAAQQHPNAQLFVWPETMVPAGLNPNAIARYKSIGSGREVFHHQIQSLAKTLQAHLLVGANAYLDWKTVASPDGASHFDVPGRRFNSVFHYRPDGAQAPRWYDKIHRVPFGEYLPWVENNPWLKQQFIRHLSPYEVDYTIYPGKQWTVFEIPVSGQGTDETDHPSVAARIATPICFEDAVARVTRAMVYGPDGRKRADLLVNLTNDGWYAGTHQGPQHLQIAVLRCIENRVPMARSVNTGVSGFIDAAGRVGPLVRVDGRHQAVQGFASTLMRVDPRRTLFSRWGHWPVGMMAGVTLALAMGGWFKRIRSSPIRDG